MSDQANNRRAGLLLAVVMAGSMLGMSGTDMMLPAIPAFADLFNSTAQNGQLVIATYGAGVTLGLLLFGFLTGRFKRVTLLLVAFTGFTVAAAFIAQSTNVLLILCARFGQGLCAAAAPVYAAGLIRSIFDDEAAGKVIGALGSLESLAPAFAPLLGVWIYAQQGWGGWSGMFWVMAGLGALLMIITFTYRLGEPSQAPRVAPQKMAGYFTLLRDPTYLRYAVATGAGLAGLITIVAAAPAVIVNAMGGTSAQFIAMQIIGIAGFIAAANTAPRIAPRFGRERVIYWGVVMCLLAAIAMVVYALMGGRDPIILIILFFPMNVGLGLRGPLVFLAAIQSAFGSDDKASSLMMIISLALSAGATALVAPFIESGLIAPAIAATILQAATLAALIFLPPLVLNDDA
ncbi:MAG: MFS transporter [Alphaproteobacteria bacterium]